MRVTAETVAFCYCQCLFVHDNQWQRHITAAVGYVACPVGSYHVEDLCVYFQHLPLGGNTLLLEWPETQCALLHHGKMEGKRDRRASFIYF